MIRVTQASASSAEYNRDEDVYKENVGKIATVSATLSMLIIVIC